VLPVIRELQAAGATSHNAIAKKLNARNVPTARGRKWSHVQVAAAPRRGREARELQSPDSLSEVGPGVAWCSDGCAPPAQGRKKAPPKRGSSSNREPTRGVQSASLHYLPNKDCLNWDVGYRGTGITIVEDHDPS
jgi:hypothetical protein